MEVRPWFIADSKCRRIPEERPDPRKTVFIGGVPRPMKAHELADIVEKKFGEVTFAAIDLDTDVNYPKGERWIYVHTSVTSLLLTKVMHASCYLLFSPGAGRVSFTSTNSFMAAVATRFFQMTYGDSNKRVSLDIHTQMHTRMHTHTNLHT